MKEKALILFLKYPEKGAVKTRIAKALGDDFTLKLYTCFVADILEISRNIDADTFILYSLTDNAKNKGWFGKAGHVCLPQKGADIGRRMHNAFRDICSQGYQKVVLIGSDVPDLPASYIEKAFQGLTDHELVLGPSIDGGYYLIALRDDTVAYGIFNDVPWSTSQVLQRTLENIHQLNITYSMLPSWSDIDEVDDLRRFYGVHKKKRGTSHTMELLYRNEEILSDHIKPILNNGYPH